MGNGTGAHERAEATTGDGVAAGAPGTRVVVVSLALLALALVAVVVYLLGGGASGDVGSSSAQDGVDDPAAVLEDALASGTPAYVLIHSNT